MRQSRRRRDGAPHPDAIAAPGRIHRLEGEPRAYQDSTRRSHGDDGADRRRTRRLQQPGCFPVRRKQPTRRRRNRADHLRVGQGPHRRHAPTDRRVEQAAPRPEGDLPGVGGFARRSAELVRPGLPGQERQVRRDLAGRGLDGRVRRPRLAGASRRGQGRRRRDPAGGQGDGRLRGQDVRRPVHDQCRPAVLPVRPGQDPADHLGRVAEGLRDRQGQQDRLLRRPVLAVRGSDRERRRGDQLRRRILPQRGRQDRHRGFARGPRRSAAPGRHVLQRRHQQGRDHLQGAGERQRLPGGQAALPAQLALRVHRGQRQGLQDQGQVRHGAVARPERRRRVLAGRHQPRRVRLLQEQGHGQGLGRVDAVRRGAARADQRDEPGLGAHRALHRSGHGEGLAVPAHPAEVGADRRPAAPDAELQRGQPRHPEERVRGAAGSAVGR